jgi:hypothetical protein
MPLAAGGRRRGGTMPFPLRLLLPPPNIIPVNTQKVTNRSASHLASSQTQKAVF